MRLKLEIELPDDYTEETYDKTRLALDVMGEYARLFAAKQEAYSADNIRLFGERGVLVRAADKVMRLKSLLFEARTNNLESIDDSWTDLMGYGVIGKMVHKGLWK